MIYFGYRDGSHRVPQTLARDAAPAATPVPVYLLSSDEQSKCDIPYLGTAPGAGRVSRRQGTPVDIPGSRARGRRRDVFACAAGITSYSSPLFG